MTTIETPEDRQWLLETHLRGHVVPPFNVAVIDGNEDCPYRISCYARNHYECIPRVYTATADGYVVTQNGDNPFDYCLWCNGRYTDSSYFPYCGSEHALAAEKD